MLIDLYNGLEKRSGRTAEDTDDLRPGDFRLSWLLVPLRQDGRILWKKDGQSLTLFQGYTPAGESSLAAALNQARIHLGAQIDVSALRLLSHRMDREHGLIQDVYLAFAGQDVPAPEDGRWLYPEEILGDPALSASLNREDFYQAHRDTLSRLSGEMRVPRGRYLSWQGERLQVIGIAVHTVTNVPLVVCQAEGGDRGLWAVPLSRWTQPVRTQDGLTARYAFLAAE